MQSDNPRFLSIESHRFDSLRVSEGLELPERNLTWLTALKDGTGEQVSTLASNSSVVFTLALTNLSALAHTAESHPVSESLRTVIAAAERPIELQAVLLTDSEAIERDQDQSLTETLQIDIGRLEGAPASSVDAALETALGHVDYRLRISDKQGWTYISVVLIKDGRPLDQVVSRYCVGTCGDDAPAGRVPGSDTLAAMLSSSTETDAALFLTELETNKLHGILVLAEPYEGQRIWVWSTTRTGVGFKSYLTTTIQPLFEAWEPSLKEMLQKGDALTDFVFPNEPDADAGRAAFAHFVAKSPEDLGDGLGPSTLFVKFDFASAGDEEPTYVPAGLMTVPVDGHDLEEFVGKRVLIEQPLGHPSYVEHDKCPGNWVALVPTETSGVGADLRLARTALLRNEPDWSTNGNLRVFNAPAEFVPWLREKSHGPTALVVLSHHDANRLYFYEDEPGVVSSSVRSKYGAPSFAILNACGIGKQGATDFVTRFNLANVNALIVSNFNVHPAVAGTYLRCFQQEAAVASEKGLPLAYIHHQAVNACKWGPNDDLPLGDDSVLTSELYSMNALKYLLLGDRQTRICAIHHNANWSDKNPS